MITRPLTVIRSVAFRLIGSNTSTSMCGIFVFSNENSCCNEQDGCNRCLDGFDGKLDRFDESNAETKFSERRFAKLATSSYHHLQAAVIRTVFAMPRRSSKRGPIDLVTMLSVPYPATNYFVLVAMQNLKPHPYDRQMSISEHFVWNYSTKVNCFHRVPNAAR